MIEHLLDPEHLGDLSDWVQIVLTVIAAGIAWRQWRQAREVTRSEHLRELLAVFKDDHVVKPYYQFIDNVPHGGVVGSVYEGNLRFVKTQVDGVDAETAIDNMLLVFSTICHEHRMGVIREEEFSFFGYQIKRTLAHKDIKQYLKDFAQHSKLHKHDFPFLPLLQEGLSFDKEYYGPVMDDLCSQHSIIRKLDNALTGVS